MHISQSRRAMVLVTSAAVAAGIGLGVAPAAQAASGKVTIDNTLPRWLGHASKSAVTPFTATTQTVRVYLTPNGGADALNAAVAAVSDPSSAQYRQFLTTAQYDAKYAPTQAQVDQVSGYLSGAGLAVTGVEAQRRYVEASGSAGQLGAAFGVQLGTFTHDGQTVTAPSSAAAVPSSIAGNVLTVTGLDTTAYTKKVNRIAPGDQSDTAKGATNPNVTPPTGFVNARPCSIYYGQVAAQFQADFSTPLPTFQGQTLSYARCGYTGATVPVRVREQLHPDRGGRDGRHHRRVRLAEDRQGREPVRREPRRRLLQAGSADPEPPGLLQPTGEVRPERLVR
ncbi:MAG: protease pro-enzyme activation domain-containing protein [Actinomycetales bacterium]